MAATYLGTWLVLLVVAIYGPVLIGRIPSALLWRDRLADGSVTDWTGVRPQLACFLVDEGLEGPGIGVGSQ